MKILLTSGPSYEPLDAVRRLTNLSTGELGTRLATDLAAAGHEVTCFRSSSSTHPGPGFPVKTVPFETNGDLEQQLRQFSAREEVQAILHVAALCDFRIRDVRDEQGRPLARDKISSRAGLVQLTLEPLPKLLPLLRTLFPRSLIIGWKYEKNGPPSAVLAQGRQQMEKNQSDLCVVNGPGYGPGFSVLNRSGGQVHLEDKAELSAFLTQGLKHPAQLVSALESVSASRPLVSSL